MVNHFRTTLMNLSEAGPAVISEYISTGFRSQTLPADLSAFRTILFPSSTRSDVLARATAYTMLLSGVGLDDLFTLRDPRITYNLTDLTLFGVAAYDLEGLAESVIINPITTTMLSYNSNYPKYTDYVENGITNLQKLAGTIANYSYKLG